MACSSDNHHHPSKTTAVPSEPGAPTVASGNAQLNVSWSEVTEATAYEIYSSEIDNSATATLFGSTSDTSCIINGLSNGTVYYVWVKAENSAGTSGFSPVGSGTPSEGSTTWPAGVFQSGTNAYDYAIGMVKDNSGNIYITGYTTGNMDGYTNSGEPYDYDLFLIKYSASGEKQWTKMIQTVGRVDMPFGIAYDGSDGIYLTGYSSDNLDGQNPDNNECIFIAKFSTGGSELWVKLYETAVVSKGYSLACSGGSVYLTGTADNGSNGFDLFLAKYNAAGVEQWKKYYGGVGYECGQAIALDASGNIYVTGNSDTGMILYKFDDSGEKLWDTGNTNYINGMAIALDGSANVYITGRTDSSNGFLVKYNTSGVLQWENLIQADQDCGSAVKLDSTGNIYVSGSTRGNLDGETNSGNSDGFLIKYSAAGTRQWTKLLGSGALDGFNAMVLESDEYIFVFGHTEGALPGNSSLGSLDFFIAQYGSAGDLQ